MMNERMVTLLRFDTIEQTTFARERLENAGIRVFVIETGRTDKEPGGSNVGIDRALPMQNGCILVQVPEHQATEAGAVLEENADQIMGQNPSTR